MCSVACRNPHALALSGRCGVSDAPLCVLWGLPAGLLACCLAGKMCGEFLACRCCGAVCVDVAIHRHSRSTGNSTWARVSRFGLRMWCPDSQRRCCKSAPHTGCTAVSALHCCCSPPGHCYSSLAIAWCSARCSLRTTDQVGREVSVCILGWGSVALVPVEWCAACAWVEMGCSCCACGSL